MNRFIKAFRKVRQTFNEMPRGSAVGATFRHALFVLLLLITGVGSAWAQTSVWDGKDEANKFPSGSGTEDDPYIISNASEFAYFGKKDRAAYYKLTINIDLGGYEWKYGENSSTTFKGHFDGNGKTVKNFKIVPKSGKVNGLFCTIQGTSSTARAEVKNLTIDSVTISTSDLDKNTYTGGLVGNVGQYADFVNDSVKNVNVSYKNLTNTNYIGAFAGRVQKNSTIKTCSVDKSAIDITGDMTTASSYIGGAIGQFAGTSAEGVSSIDGLTVSSSSVTINKVSFKECRIGAVLGYISTYSGVKNVTVSKPSLTYKDTDSPNIDVRFGTFAGEVNGDADKQVKVNNITMSDATMTIGTGSNSIANIKAGAIGRVSTNVLLDTLSFSGNNKITIDGDLATTTSYIGGLAGYVASASSVSTTVKNLTLSASATMSVTVTGSTKVSPNIGGFFGFMQSAANAPLVIKNITMKGKSSVEVKGSAPASAYLGGFAAYVSVPKNTNAPITIDGVDMSGCTTTLSIDGDISAESYMGGCIGRLYNYASDTYKGDTITVSKVKVGKSNISVTGNITGESYFGGLIGRVHQLCAIDSCTVSNPTLTFDGNISSKSPYIGGAIGRITGTVGYPSSLRAITVTKPTLKLNGKVGNTSYLGGMLGYADTYVSVNSNKVENPAISITKDESHGTLYIGGAVGYAKGVVADRTLIKGNTVSKASLAMNGKVGNTFYMGGFLGYAENANVYNNKVAEPAISMTNDINAEAYIGGAVGRQGGYTTIDGMTVSGGSITGPTSDKTIINNKAIFFGGFIGQQNSSGTAATQPNKFMNVAVTDMNINLEHYVPGGTINNNKFGVGGIAGSVNAPNRDANGFCGMPENIIFKGGKIYAPYATTSPTVSNFNASNPGHNTMTTEAITTVDALDKAKTKTWYYSDYELGLSPGLLQSASIVAKGTAPAKDRFRLNCDATLKSTSVQYITVNNSTFEKQNRYQDSERDSKTVLWWTTTAAVGKAAAQQFTNEEQPCYPHQAGEAATQYPYYWYFFQGVANANYAKAAVADSIISGIAANMTQAAKAKPITLTIKNDKEGERGFDERTITVAAKTVDAEGNETDATGITYQWYLNGADAGTGSSIKLTPHWKDGQGLTVNALSGKTVVATATYTLAPGVMKTKTGDTEKVRSDINGRGTKANPYIIDCENALRQLSYLSTVQTGTLWEGIVKPAAPFATNQIAGHYNRAYYELGADIKMSSDPFTPISHVGYGSDGTWGTYSGNFIFQGCFDGKGHKISGLNITWGAGQYNGNDANVYYGLFGAVGNIQEGKSSAPAVGSIKWGESSTTNTVIKNVVLDNATLTHDVNNKTFSYSEPYSHITGDNANNCMVGVLVGLVGSHTTIDNIEIRGSHIKDTGSSDYSLATRGLFVGGAIGSVQVAFNKTAYAPEVNISHIAAQVDIELTHPKFANEKADAQLGMFNVGGIIGRYIATSATQAQAQAAMPSHTLFSGTVNAPKAWISPVLASLRYVSQNGVKFADYSLQYEGNNKTAATQIKITDAQFYNYFIRDRKMTDAFPDVKCALGTRTIVRHADGAENEREYTTFSYQGVNYGAVYIDEVGTSLELLNKDMDEKEGFSWQWDEDGKFVHMSTEPYVSVCLTREGNTFTANFNGDAQRYTWMGSVDGTTWYEIKNQGTEVYNGHTSLKDIYVRVIVSDVTKSYKSLIEKIEGDMALYTPEIKDAEVGDNTTLTLNLNSKPGVPADVFDIAYQWYKSPDETTGKIDGESTNVMTINTETLKTEYSNTLWCKTTVTDKDLGIVIADFLTIYGGTVIYVNGNKYKRDDGINVGTGNDNNNGLTPATPVLTINKANSLLKSVEKGGTWDNNFIVIMGVLNPDNDFRSAGPNPATLTGKWNNVDYEGVIKLKQIDPNGDENNLNPVCTGNLTGGANCYVLGDTKFQYLTISGNKGANTFIECHGNDVWFGKGLVMDNFANLSSNHGNYNEKTKFYPEFTVILTATNLSRSKIEEYGNRTKPQVLTVESGHYGRILAGRFTQKFFGKADNDSHGIFGSPKKPLWAVINIDIDKDNPNPGNAWTKDINCVVAGLTDGSMYGDVEINIHGGDIDYVVGANQGNPVPNGDKEFTHVDGDFGKWGQWPNSSFFGRSVINVDQNSNLKDVTIGNIYAGGLGRKNQGKTEVPSIVDMYLYGRTEINMKGGSIDASLYGGGAGGVIGLSPWDAHVPYATVENTEDDMENGIINGVQYGTWGTKKDGDKLPTVILHNPNDAGGYDEEELNLSKSSTTLNISGGNVNGNVFGGGCGFTENMDQVVCMQAVGSVFGNSNVNITGGTIQGSVYGGGQGDKKYFGATNFYGQTIEHIAETNGYINVNVTGTEEKCPVIHGDIYGAGMGIKSEGEQEYLRIATTGNKDLKLISEDGYPTAVNLVIDLPESKPFGGNIYGGGEFGMVDGDTNVVLKRGTFTGNVFGGGKGENGHPDKAKVVGSTHVKVGETEISE